MNKIYFLHTRGFGQRAFPLIQEFFFDYEPFFLDSKLKKSDTDYWKERIIQGKISFIAHEATLDCLTQAPLYSWVYLKSEHYGVFRLHNIEIDLKWKGNVANIDMVFDMAFLYYELCLPNKGKTGFELGISFDITLHGISKITSTLVAVPFYPGNGIIWHKGITERGIYSEASLLVYSNREWVPGFLRQNEVISVDNITYIFDGTDLRPLANIYTNSQTINSFILSGSSVPGLFVTLESRIAYIPNDPWVELMTTTSEEWENYGYEHIPAALQDRDYRLHLWIHGKDIGYSEIYMIRR